MSSIIIIITMRALQKEAEAVLAADAASAHSVQTGQRNRPNLQARLYLAIPVVSVLAWLAIFLLDMGPWLQRVYALDSPTAIALGAIWALAVILSLRASFGARPHTSEPEQ